MGPEIACLTERDMPIRFSPMRDINRECRAEAEAADNYQRHGCRTGYTCGQSHPDLRNWYCTRNPGHEGVHVAAGSDVCYRWPWVPGEGE